METEVLQLTELKQLTVIFYFNEMNTPTPQHSDSHPCTTLAFCRIDPSSLAELQLLIAWLACSITSIINQLINGINRLSHNINQLINDFARLLHGIRLINGQGPGRAPQPLISRVMQWIHRVMHLISRFMPWINRLIESIHRLLDPYRPRF